MAEHTTVSIDGMGGDNAPDMIVGGIELICSREENLKVLLFGDESRLRPLIDANPHAAASTEIRHTDQVVAGEDKPTQALRSGKNSSMRLAIDAVAGGEAGAVVSAGNTGALMAMASVVLKKLPGISRPAIVTSFPNQIGQTVMLDLGGNVDCDAENLVQFAVMGEVYARYELGLKEPKIGILNIGVEGLKGNESVKEASAILQESNLPIRFIGFVEGDDITKGTVDVVVTDGFTGNVALKTAEGTAQMFAKVLKSTLTDSFAGKLGALIAKPALNQLRDHFDPRRYNGALFVGLNGICIKSHGGTDAVGFAHAIEKGLNLARNRVNHVIREDLARVMTDSRESINAAE